MQDVQVDYGYNLTIGIYEKDYQENAGKDYSGLTFTDGSTKLVYYNQTDVRWKDESYGLSDTVGTSGCGPTALAMVISNLNSHKVNPKEMVPVIR